MGKSQRTKGANFERQIAKALREHGIAAKRGIGQARSASEVADVQVAGWWSELKCGGPARYPLKALAQARDAAQATNLRPVAICRVDFGPVTCTFEQDVGGVPMVITVSFEDWVRLVKHAG